MWRSPQHSLIWRDPYLGLWILLLALAAGVIWWSNADYDVDDAPITYRYAENLASGQGFVYNPGERVLGTSTPLYTLLLAGLRLLGVPIALASTVINFMASLGIFALVIALTRLVTPSPWAAALAVLYLLLQGSFLRFVMAGMETPLYTLIILATFWALATERQAWAAVLAALAFLLRLDGLAVMGTVGLALLLHQRRIPWRAVLIFTVLVAPWLIFATLYFGSPLPQSMLAKQGHLATTGASRYWIWQHLFVDGLGAPTFLLPVALIGLLHGLRSNQKPLLQTLPALCWFVAYLVAYTIIGIDFYEWYLMPLYPMLAIWVGVGLTQIIALIRQATTSKLWRLAQEMSVLLLLLVWLLPYRTYMLESVPYFKGYLNDVEGSRVAASRWLKTAAPPDSRIYTGFIGHVGYESGLYIIDGAGLVTPPQQRATANPTTYVLEGYVPNRRECGPVRTFPTDYIGDTLVSFCNQPPYATLGELTLAGAQITRRIQTPKGEWYNKDDVYLETQWLIESPPAPQAWTVFVHITDADGNTLAQADHELGLQVDRSVVAIDQWDPAKRIYVYAAMPEDWDELAAQATALRIGLWNPDTGTHLAAAAGRALIDEAGRLILPVREGELE